MSKTYPNRTLRKAAFNRLLSWFGYIIVTHHRDDGSFIRHELRHYPENCKFAKGHPKFTVRDFRRT